MVQSIKRRFWLKKIAELWKRTNLIWLYGVRRVGKTYLCRSVSNIEYFDCELPRIRRMFTDPEEFFKGIKGKKIVIDEIHRLGNPSEVLKIATDYHRDIKIIATGSSTLGSSAKFRDTLMGRKKDLWLLPVTYQDLTDFKRTDMGFRLQRGGLPPFFLAKDYPEYEFQEWMDAFWAKDIQELFRLERRYSFQRFMELLFSQSGGIFEATYFAGPCEVSRSTISNYLKVLDATVVVRVIRPFSTYRPTEIVSAPKVYAFDTGFVSYFKGWDRLRKEDMGLLWEHFVLNEISAHFQEKRIFYWRDKRGHEIDFVVAPKGKSAIAIEAKWNTASFDPVNVFAFRRRYPVGENLVVCYDIEREFSRKYGNLRVKFLDIRLLIKEIK